MSGGCRPSLQGRGTMGGRSLRPILIVGRRKVPIKQRYQGRAVWKHLPSEQGEGAICLADELIPRRGVTSELMRLWSAVGKKAKPRWFLKHLQGTKRIECRHEELAVGQRCPVCGQGTLTPPTASPW